MLLLGSTDDGQSCPRPRRHSGAIAESLGPSHYHQKKLKFPGGVWTAEGVERQLQELEFSPDGVVGNYSCLP